MTNYDFSTLNSTDLENLVCELLNAEHPEGSSIKYRTFKEGKDQGIDFLYSTPLNQHEHVGQVKHYLKTGISSLLRKLKNEEVKKVKKLAPNKYIFATSLPLSKANCLEIESIFSPFIKNIKDIYGRDDLNRLITSHKNIEKSNYKLWFSSINVLETILKTDLEFRSSSFIQDELIKRIKLYVITPIFDEARQFLKEKKFMIITGDPGTGKTSLAEMLLYEYIKDGYRLSFIIDDVRDAEREIKRDDSKQIIYFDDFLGSNEMEIQKAMASEAKLLRLLAQIEHNTNKFLILTTRSNLFSKAINNSERLKQREARLNNKVVDLKTYTKDIKEQILINHIDEADIDEKFKDVINDAIIKKYIVSHQNFSPRAIEYITSKYQIDKIEPKEYESFIRSSLDSPTSIWEHAYLNQTDIYEKLLLQTLLTFGDSSDLDILEKAFNARVEYEIRTRNIEAKPHCWKITLRQLMDGFVININSEIAFINPSLTDYLISFLQSDNKEVEQIVNSVVHIDQITTRLFRLSSYNRPDMPQALQSKLLTDYSSFLSGQCDDEDFIRLALLMHQYIDSIKNEKIITELLNRIGDWSSLVEDFELNTFFKEFINELSEHSSHYAIIKSKISEIINDTILGLWDIEDVLSVLEEYSSKFKITNFVSDETIDHIKGLFDDEVNQQIDDLSDWMRNESDEEDARKELLEKIEEFGNHGIDLKEGMQTFDSTDWWEIAMTNEVNYLASKDD